MDTKLVKFLGNDEVDELRSLEKLFAEPGWEVVKKHAEKRVEDCKDAQLTAPDFNAHQRALGMRLVYEELRDFQSLALGYYDTLVQSRQDAALLAAEDDYANTEDFS
jgi:hypothetical protein